MRFVKPEVRLIAGTKVLKTEAEEWLLSIGVDSITAENYAYVKAGMLPDGVRVTELAGRRCYKSFQAGLNPNVTRIRADIQQYCDNILASGHGSVLEHVYFTFAIENVSRVFTGEMNRHRAGVAISEGSMRYIRYTDIPMVETPLLSLTDADVTDSEYREYINSPFDANVLQWHSLAVKKARTRAVFERVCRVIEAAYIELQEIWADELKPESAFKWKKHITSLLRRIIPMGVATGGVWTMNIRALRHICTMRCSEAAEEEIALVAGKILEIMMREEPNLFGDFHKDDSGYWVPKYVKV